MIMCGISAVLNVVLTREFLAFCGASPEHYTKVCCRYIYIYITGGMDPSGGMDQNSEY